MKDDNEIFLLLFIMFIIGIITALLIEIGLDYVFIIYFLWLIALLIGLILTMEEETRY